MSPNVGSFIDNGDNPLIDSYCISDYQTSVNNEHDRGMTADLSHSIKDIEWDLIRKIQ